jgi:hypothetical protein
MDKDKPRHPKSDPHKLSPAFNARAQNVSEVENKFLLKTNDPSVFENIINTFRAKGWIRHETLDTHLLTRQMDTLDFSLTKRGSSIRIRGNSKDNDLGKIDHPDICVKTGKSVDPSGALRRGEYESRIANFEIPTYESLQTKYPKDKYPELYEVLDGIKPEDLHEFFRIDCYRNSYLLEIPASETGLDYPFVVEMETDDILYVMDIPGYNRPLIFHHDRELESEAKFTPSEYVENASKNVFTPPTSKEQADRVMQIVKTLIMAAGEGNLVENYDSKSERGFKALDEALKSPEVRKYVEVKRHRDGEKSAAGSMLQSAFALSSRPANDNSPQEPVKIHRLLPPIPDLSAVLSGHTIALRK